MLEEPRVHDPRPFGVRSGRAVSALIMFPWPFLLIAAVSTLRTRPGGILRGCVSTWGGAFLCAGAAYPLLLGLAVAISVRALRARRTIAAGLAAWAPALALLLLALLAATPAR